MHSVVYLPLYYFSGSGAGHSLKEAGIFWSLLMIVSFLFQAADTVLKVSFSEWFINFSSQAHCVMSL